MLNKILKIVLVANLVALDGIVGYLLYKPNSNTQISSVQTKTEYVDQCGEDCRQYVDDKVNQLVPSASSGQAVLQLSPTPLRQKASAGQAVKTRKEEVLTIPGEGSTGNMSWTDITATNFYFDTKDYPGLVEVYFEVKMKLLNGNGYGYTRLFDVTSGIAVNGSENNTNSQTEVWTKSQKVYFWAGKNFIRVQAKSLTADTVVYTQGRLRIVTEN